MPETCGRDGNEDETVEYVLLEGEAPPRWQLRTPGYPELEEDNIRTDSIGFIREFMRGIRVLLDGALDAAKPSADKQWRSQRWAPKVGAKEARSEVN